MIGGGATDEWSSDWGDRETFSNELWYVLNAARDIAVVGRRGDTFVDGFSPSIGVELGLVRCG